jgi:outer membrane lipopolysaccharide assembly protein LptE/RlpB
MRRRLSRAALLGLLALAGCAHYSTSAGLVGGIRSVAIPIAENDTAELDIGQRLTERATDAFVADGRLSVVDEETADAQLWLRIERLEDEPFTFTTAEVTEQYRFRLFGSAQLERADGSSLLEIERLVGWGTYDAVLPDEEGREPAIDTAMDMMIEEILDRTTSSW